MYRLMELGLAFIYSLRLTNHDMLRFTLFGTGSADGGFPWQWPTPTTIPARHILPTREAALARGSIRRGFGEKQCRRHMDGC